MASAIDLHDSLLEIEYTHRQCDDSLYIDKIV